MNWTIADFISLLALAVVIWYTWETRRIRIETAKNNKLLVLFQHRNSMVIILD